MNTSQGTVSPNSSAITKSKGKKKTKSIAKLLRLPTSNPHDRLSTLHARLDLPRPYYTIIEQRRYRAIVRDDSAEATPTAASPTPTNKGSKQIVQEAWTATTSTNADDHTWSSTPRAAIDDAAQTACKHLEIKLVQRLTGGADGGADPVMAAAGVLGMEEDKDMAARLQVAVDKDVAKAGGGVRQQQDDREDNVGRNAHESDCDFDDYGIEIDFS